MLGSFFIGLLIGIRIESLELSYKVEMFGEKG